MPTYTNIDTGDSEIWRLYESITSKFSTNFDTTLNNNYIWALFFLLGTAAVFFFILRKLVVEPVKRGGL